MNRIRLTTIALAAVLAASSADALDAQQELVLESNLPAVGLAVVGVTVTLREPAPGKCRYFGTLVQTEVPDASMEEKLMSSALGTSKRWAMHLTRKVCPDLMTDVALAVPMRRLWTDEYRGGIHVLALPR